MHPSIAYTLIKAAISPEPQVWVDLGAGTGLFTEVLRDQLPAGSRVIALDKSPHMLWRLEQRPEVPIQIEDGDFTRPMEIGTVDVILMANALHYVADPESVLPQILYHLKPGGKFVLIEYETDKPLNPWIPYPIPFQNWGEIAANVGLNAPVEIGRAPSQYGHQHIYSAVSSFS